jgi:hypothetical protein
MEGWMIRKPVILLALGVSVLLQFDPVEVTVYLDSPPGTASVDAIVTEAACHYIQAEEVPLPVPYTVRLLTRAGESLRFTPHAAPLATGVLSRCAGTVRTLSPRSASDSRGPGRVETLP